MIELPSYVVSQVVRLSTVAAEQKLTEGLLVKWFESHGHPFVEAILRDMQTNDRDPFGVLNRIMVLDEQEGGTTCPVSNS